MELERCSLPTLATFTLKKKILCEIFIFFVAVVAEINHAKELQCGLFVEMLHKGEPLE